MTEFHFLGNYPFMNRDHLNINILKIQYKKGLTKGLLNVFKV